MRIEHERIQGGVIVDQVGDLACDFLLIFLPKIEVAILPFAACLWKAFSK